MIGKLTPPNFGQLAVIIPDTKSELIEQSDSFASAAAIPVNREDVIKLDNAVNIASRATDEIVKLRERQSDLLGKMESANDSKRSRLISAYNEIDGEITRIGTEATYGGINLISGQAFSIQSSKELFSESLVLPNLSILTTSYSLDKSDSSISSTKAAIKVALSSAYIAYSGFESRSDKAAKIVSDINQLMNLPDDGTKRNSFKSNSATVSTSDPTSLSKSPTKNPNDIDIIV